MGRRLTQSAGLKEKARTQMWDAVKEFNKMVPMLNGYVRALTGNPQVRVVAGKQTETDGKTIFIRPPLALGKKVQHDRTLCEKRDSTRQLLCTACVHNEDIQRRIHHELAHILGNTFVRPGGLGLADIMRLVDEYHPDGVCQHGSAIKANVLASKTYLDGSAQFSGFLHYLFQSLEDARIDADMISVKPGLRTVFYAATSRTFLNGVEGDDEDAAPFLWREAPVNSQAIIGLGLISSGYVIEGGWLSPAVTSLLDDTQLREIATNAAGWADAHVAASRAVAAFRRLVELGLCETPKCEPPPPPTPSLNKPNEDTEGEESDESDSDQPDGDQADSEGDGGQTGDESDSDEESDGDSDQSSGDDAEPDGSGDGSGGDEGDPTGDGAAGETASDGAFGDDFENDDRTDGDDQQGGSSDDQSDEASVPGDDERSDSAGADGDSDDGDNEDGGEQSTPGSSDQADADGSDDEQSEVEASDAADQEGGSGDPESGDSPTEPSGSDGDEDGSQPDGATDGSSSPADPAARDGADEHDREADDATSVAPDGEGDLEDQSTTPQGASVEAEEVGTDSLTEDLEPETDEPIGANVWEEENPESIGVDALTSEELGDADQVAEDFEKGSPHEHLEDASSEDEDAIPGYTMQEVEEILQQALNEALGMAHFFSRVSQEVGGVSEYTFPSNILRWQNRYDWTPSKFMPAEAVLNGALVKARAVFADNLRSKNIRNVRSGKIDTRKLGYRAPTKDDRLFRQRTLPGRKSYIVGITVDCSGSTEDRFRMERIKRSVFAMAEILSRLGVKFYISGHTGGREDYWTNRSGWIGARQEDPTTLENLMILWIKKEDEPWNDETRKRLASLPPLANNFDGHTLEFHRKRLESARETDKVLMYYTDGAMPAANYAEELSILQEEIPTCKRLGIALAAVGINTDSPSKYGFDTVQVDKDEDITKVVTLLERHLTE